jgi:hypothetical protein
VVRRTFSAIAWILAAVVIALGAAGLVAALDHLPGGTGRPELTRAADRAVAGDLDVASAELIALADAVGVLGGHGRMALSALVGRDAPALAVALDEGTAQLDVIDGAAARLADRLASLPLAGADRVMRHSAVTLARYDAAVGALAAVDPLRPAWDGLIAGVVPATGLTEHLLAHDRIAATAIQSGGAGKYAQAIARIDKAAAELVAARVIRDRLAAAIDVGTLDEWLERNVAYDDALRGLWDALRRSGGRVTKAVRDAAARESSARELLPPDARALVVILGDVARGGLNQAVVTIEEARGRLLDSGARVGASPAP